MPRLYVTVSALAMLVSPAAIASAGPIIVGTVPPPASSAATAPAAAPAPAETTAAKPAAPAPTPAPEPAPAPKAAAAAPAAAPATAAAGAPVAPDMKNFPNTMDFLAANRTFRSQVAMAWAKGQIDAPTFRSLMATYRSNVQAGKIASAK